MAAPSTPTARLDAPHPSGITARSSRRLLPLQSFFHHLDEAYEKKEEIEKQQHGGVLDEESQQRLLGSEPVPFELSESSSESDSESSNSDSETVAPLPNASDEANTSASPTPTRPIRATSAENVSSAPFDATLHSTAPISDKELSSSMSNGNSQLNGTPKPIQVNTGVRVPLRPGSRSQTLIEASTTSKITLHTDSVSKRPSAVGSLTSFWEKINEKEKEEADRLRVKHSGAARSTRTSAIGLSPSSPKFRSDSGVKLTATGTSPISPRSPRPSNIATGAVSPRVSPAHTGELPPSSNHSHSELPRTSPRTEKSNIQSESPSVAPSEPESQNTISTSSDLPLNPADQTPEKIEEMPKPASDETAVVEPSEHVGLVSSPSESNVIAVSTKKTKSGKSLKVKDGATESSSDGESLLRRDSSVSPDQGRKKRSSSRKKSLSPKTSEAEAGAEFSSEIIPSSSSESVSHQDGNQTRSTESAMDGAGDSSSQDTSTTSSSKSPKSSIRKGSLVVPEPKRDRSALLDKDRGAQSDAEGYSESQKERKKKSKQNAARANSTSQLPKERVQIRERKDSKSPSSGVPASGGLKSLSGVSSPDLTSHSKVAPSKVDSKVDVKASKVSSKESGKDSGKLSVKDSPKEKSSKKRSKRSSSKSSSKDRSESNGSPVVGSHNGDAEVQFATETAGANVSENADSVATSAPLKAGRKKKKRAHGGDGKKKSSGGGGGSQLGLEEVEQATQSITSPATGQIELGKLRAFFATWDPKAMTHSWEINPQEVEFVELIGEGTSCAVYKGTYRGQVVALKVLKDINTKQLTNFVKEFDIISDFRSPHVVFFFGACIEPIPVMVLGLCPRGSLYDVLKRGDATMTWSSLVKVCISTLRGLDSLHKWKPQIVHRDLKSRNILVEDDWSAKLCDFGESRYNTGTNLDTLCKIRGTYAYIAPEVYFGQSFTTKSDVYAFGVILWEICNYCVRGNYTAPFAEYKTLVYDFQIIVQASRKGMRPSIDPTTPTALSNIIQLCWDHEPDNRPHAHEILKFFEEVAADTSKPHEWIKAKNALHWPPPLGPGHSGAPPRTSTSTLQNGPSR